MGLGFLLLGDAERPGEGRVGVHGGDGAEGGADPVDDHVLHVGVPAAALKLGRSRDETVTSPNARSMTEPTERNKRCLACLSFPTCRVSRKVRRYMTTTYHICKCASVHYKESYRFLFDLLQSVNNDHGMSPD